MCEEFNEAAKNLLKYNKYQFRNFGLFIYYFVFIIGMVEN
jgi:hypothetical protein